MTRANVLLTILLAFVGGAAVGFEVGSRDLLAPTVFTHGPRADGWTERHWSEPVGWSQLALSVKPADTSKTIAHWSSDSHAIWYPDTRLTLSSDRRTALLYLNHPRTSEHPTEECKLPWVIRANPDGSLSVGQRRLQ